MTAFHQAKGENPLAKRYQEIVDYIKEKIDSTAWPVGYKLPREEFNLVLDGTVIVTFDNQELVLNKGDSIYFNPKHPHGQKCGSETPATFLTMIAE